MSFKRKLFALNFPTPDKFDPSDQSQYRGLVVWLEDQKIRQILANIEGDSIGVF